MILAVLASDMQKKEIAVSAFFQKHEVVFSENISLWAHHNADAYIDFGFSPSAEKIEKLAICPNLAKADVQPSLRRADSQRMPL